MIIKNKKMAELLQIHIESFTFDQLVNQYG